jgi:hypothetical protein
MPHNFRTLVIRAGVPSINGNVYPAQVLRSLHDGKRVFWDEDKKELYFSEPLPMSYRDLEFIHNNPAANIASFKTEG